MLLLFLLIQLQAMWSTQPFSLSRTVAPTQSGLAHSPETAAQFSATAVSPWRRIRPSSSRPLGDGPAGSGPEPAVTSTTRETENASPATAAR